MSKKNHPEQDIGYIDRILKFAQRAENYLEIDPGVTQEITLDAISKCFEEIGEVANRITPALKETEPDIPWRKITGMRNLLSHEYGETDPDILTGAARDDFPALKAALHRMRDRIA